MRESTISGLASMCHTDINPIFTWVFLPLPSECPWESGKTFSIIFFAGGQYNPSFWIDLVSPSLSLLPCSSRTYSTLYVPIKNPDPMSIFIPNPSRTSNFSHIYYCGLPLYFCHAQFFHSLLRVFCLQLYIIYDAIF